MSDNASWVAVLGATSGVSSLLIWIASLIISNVRKPKLRISQQPYVRTWNINDPATQVSHTWNFVNLEVTSERGLAIGCEAKAIVTEHPQSAGLVQELTRDGYGLHWADVPYSGRSTGVERVDIGSTPQRLDVVFTVPNRNGQSYLAMPIALLAMWNNSNIATQAVLPQGNYILRIRVSCANGKGDTKEIKVYSPNKWGDLQAEPFRRLRWYNRLFTPFRRLGKACTL